MIAAGGGQLSAAALVITVMVTAAMLVFTGMIVYLGIFSRRRR